MLRYFYAWFGMLVIAFLNAGIREMAFAPFVSDDAAHALSTATLIFLFAAYFFWLFRRWPPASQAQAWAIGILWLVLTVAFEFILGVMTGLTWEEIVADYDITQGSFWILVPLTVLIGPPVMQAIHPER